MVIKKEVELKHHARRLSIKEGMFASIKASISTRYISPFAIAINSSNSLVAMLSSVSGLLGPLSQLFSSKWMEKKSRKDIVRKSVLIEALMWIPFILIAFLFSREIIQNILPFILLLTYSVYIIFLNISIPPWFSWMGDIVDEKFRGRWFSKRNLLTGFISMVIAVFASFFLDYTRKINFGMEGFIFLFIIALLARITCWKIFNKKYEPKIKIKKQDHFSFWEFLKKAPKNNFGKFTIFRAFLAFACSISSPLVTIYLLRNLGFDYTSYIIITVSATLFSLLVMELWGKIADQYGNYKVMVITTILIPLIPLLWIISPNPLYLIFIPSLIGGISWAGFNLAASNFIYDNVNKEKRGLAVSYYNLVVGKGVFLGAGLGALLIKFINTASIEPIIIIFFLGTIARMIVVYLGISKIKEIKPKHPKKKIREAIFRELKPTLIQEADEIIHFNKYLREK